MSRLDFFALSERGLRERNDDAWCAEKVGDRYIFALADGLAGHPYGDIASLTAINTLKGAVNTAPAAKVLAAGIRQAEAEVQALSRQSPEHTGLATQLVACLIDRNLACTVIDVMGKSCMLIGKKSIRTARDASRAEHPPGSGPVAAPPSPSLADMISHVLGEPHRLKDTDFSPFTLHDEFLLLATDGLTDFLSRETIAAIVRENRSSPEAACQALVREAMQAGSDRTITVVLVHRTPGT
jgi:protein phosphatase